MTTTAGTKRPQRSGQMWWWAAGAAVTAVALVVTPVAAAPRATPEAATRTLLSVVDSSYSAAAVTAEVKALGGHVVAVYDVADALLVDLPAGASAPAGTVAVADVALHVSSLAATAAPVVAGATFRATIAADPAQQGAGVTVALVDTGVADIPDLEGRLTHVNVSGGPAGDALGHGTFLAGLVAGDGSASAGRYAGVASAAEILDVQVAAADGSTSLSRVLAGLQAVADSARADASLRVVSLALSTGSPLPPTADPLARALDRLWARGLTVVVAAGNDGPGPATVSSPGADPVVVTVGALDEEATPARGDDTVADFSSRGTAFGVAKPDLVAPGVSLVSTRAPGSIADVQNPASRVADAYFTGTGTSMSEAVVAGAAAVLVGSRPALTPDSVKRLLTSTAYRSSGLPKKAAGAGGLDLGAALAAAPRVPLLKPARWLGSAAQDAAYAPDEADAATWEQFSQAWQADDLDAVAAAWSRLSEQTRRWAATAFALALVGQGRRRQRLRVPGPRPDGAPLGHRGLERAGLGGRRLRRAPLGRHRLGRPPLGLRRLGRAPLGRRDLDGAPLGAGGLDSPPLGRRRLGRPPLGHRGLARLRLDRTPLGRGRVGDRRLDDSGVVGAPLGVDGLQRLGVVRAPLGSGRLGRAPLGRRAGVRRRERDAAVRRYALHAATLEGLA